MNKNILTYIAVILVVAGIIVLGYFIIKPNHVAESDNPYALGLDSLGEISDDMYCTSEYAAINLEGKKTHAIAIDNADRIIVSVDNSIILYQQDGTVLSSFKTDTTATALACFENLIVAGFQNKLILFDEQGKKLFSRDVADDKTYITSVDIRKNQIYVADAANALVYEYDFTGKLLKTFGQKSDKKDLSYFFLPSYYFDVTTGEEGTIWIANTGRHKLVQMNEQAEIVSHWGETSSAVAGFCGCCNPSNFAILSDGSFITAEKGIVRVKKYSKSGKFECVIAGPAAFVEDSKGLDIAVDSQDWIYILEPAGMKIHMYDIN